MFVLIVSAIVESPFSLSRYVLWGNGTKPLRTAQSLCSTLCYSIFFCVVLPKAVFCIKTVWVKPVTVSRLFYSLFLFLWLASGAFSLTATICLCGAFAFFCNPICTYLYL